MELMIKRGSKEEERNKKRTLEGGLGLLYARDHSLEVVGTWRFRGDARCGRVG